MKKRIIARASAVILVIAMSIIASGLAASAAEPYGPTHGGSLTVTKGEGAAGGGILPGSTIVLSGSGFASNASYRIAWNGVNIGTSSADASGRATYTLTVPANARPGVHTVSMTGAAAVGGTLVLASEVVVTAETVAAPISPGAGEPSVLPRTNLPLTGGVLQLYALFAGILFMSLGLGLRCYTRIH